VFHLEYLKDGFLQIQTNWCSIGGYGFVNRIHLTQDGVQLPAVLYTSFTVTPFDSTPWETKGFSFIQITCIKQKAIFITVFAKFINCILSPTRKIESTVFVVHFKKVCYPSFNVYFFQVALFYKRYRLKFYMPLCTLWGHMGERLSPLILNFGIILRWVTCFMPLHFTPGVRDPLPIGRRMNEYQIQSERLRGKKYP
jgi:hypothetical protein